jgi:hypothetical protein
MDFVIGKFLVQRGPVKDNKDGTFRVYYRVYYADDIGKERTLFQGSAEYNGNQQALEQKVNALLAKLDNTNLDNARDEIDQVLTTLAGT